MVDFVIFNELSLPILDKYEVKEKFKNFFDLLTKLSEYNLDKIRMDSFFKDYPILEGVTFYEFFGQLSNDDFKDRLRYFLSSNIIKIETPLIMDEEINYEDDNIIAEYFFDDKRIYNGLVFAYIWDTILVSFNTDKNWDVSTIELKQYEESKFVKHVSTIAHLQTHSIHLENLEKYIQQGITVNNFYELRNNLFTNKIVICQEIEKQIEGLEIKVFNKVLSVLRNLDNSTRKLTDYIISGEGETVRNNTVLRKQRTFTINGREEFFGNHIKGFYNGYRVHYFEEHDKIYIGYIGKHLTTKNN